MVTTIVYVTASVTCIRVYITASYYDRGTILHLYVLYIIKLILYILCDRLVVAKGY